MTTPFISLLFGTAFRPKRSSKLSGCISAFDQALAWLKICRLSRAPSPKLSARMGGEIWSEPTPAGRRGGNTRPPRRHDPRRQIRKPVMQLDRWPTRTCHALQRVDLGGFFFVDLRTGLIRRHRPASLWRNQSSQLRTRSRSDSRERLHEPTEFSAENFHSGHC